MKSPAAVLEFVKTVLRQVSAAYRYYKSQEYQDLHNASVAVMLKEKQREVNTGKPFASH